MAGEGVGHSLERHVSSDHADAQSIAAEEHQNVLHTGLIGEVFRVSWE